ncbi:Electron transport complex subunit C [Pyrenophora seminiperda CCB06]|uniref:Electron transport complex subunit C n=1 Tax=Pyrenophora seminiperda CCB06 TaxID=1302712 RepID=A0A3M7ME62_9PLEO|nr:Electron transport complex subunit C [Pyrenophora seminiperda CCB06]
MTHASFLKTILIPLFLAAVLYALLALILLPFVRRHRSRYSQYLPMPAAVADFPTSSWRTHVSDALYNLFVPSTWGRQRQRAVVDGSGQHDDDLFDDEEGEGMVGFDPIDERRREALEQRRSIMEEESRLGRELEEGFKDDSDDELDDERRRSLSCYP